MHWYRKEWSRAFGKKYIELFLLFINPVIIKLERKRK